MEVSTVTTKGQLVIPSKLRRKYGIRKGTKVSFTEQEDGSLILRPLTRESIHRLRGIFKGKTSLLEFLLKERKKDRIL